MEKRYVLQAEGRGMGNHFHCTFEDAKVEAERLCRKEGLSVKIWEYKPIILCQIKESPVEWVEIE